ncbi:unnamed protein product [Phaedon cochleariae]|uniref:Fanconi-associated nuclease n=1 Tax=Phaedon cochleariae TaxID=80249 RepID=A0A9P0GN73_PHACE|nr:unnamed protein product [Phaedon cochleariae]
MMPLSIGYQYPYKYRKTFSLHKFLEKKQNQLIMKYQMKIKFNAPVLIDLTQLDTDDSDSDTDTRRDYCSKTVKEFPENSGIIEFDKPNAHSTPLNSQNSISEDESSQHTIKLEDSGEDESETDNFGITFGTKSTGRVIIKQDILISSLGDLENNKPSSVSNIPEKSGTVVVAGQSVENKKHSDSSGKYGQNQEKDKLNNASALLTSDSSTKNRESEDTFSLLSSNNEKIPKKSAMGLKRKTNEICVQNHHVPRPTCTIVQQLELGGSKTNSEFLEKNPENHKEGILSKTIASKTQSHKDISLNKSISLSSIPQQTQGIKKQSESPDQNQNQGHKSLNDAAPLTSVSQQFDKSKKGSESHDRNMQNQKKINSDEALPSVGSTTISSPMKRKALNYFFPLRESPTKRKAENSSTDTVIAGQSEESIVNPSNIPEKLGKIENQVKRNLNKVKSSHVENNSMSRQADNSFLLPSKDIAETSPVEQNVQGHKKGNLTKVKQLKVLLTSVAQQTEGSKKKSESDDKNRKNQEIRNLDKALPSNVTSPSKRKADDDLFLSPSKRFPEKRPKKELKDININHVIVMNGLFKTVYTSPYLKNLVEAEKPVLKSLMTTGNPKHVFVCLKLCTGQPKWYNIFQFCKRIMIGLDDKEIINLYKWLIHKKIVDNDIYKDELPILMNDLNKVQMKSICEKFRILKTGTSKSLIKKENMMQCLLKYCNMPSTSLTKSAKDLIMEEIKRQMGYSVKLNDNFREAYYNVFILGTFTNPVFDNVNDFIDIMVNHKTAFPEYKLEDYVVFYTREEFVSYVNARKLKKRLEDTLKLNNYLELLQQSNTVFQNLQELEKNRASEDPNRYQAVPHLKQFTAVSVYLCCFSMVTEALKTKFPDIVKTWLEYLIKYFPTSHQLGDWYNQLTWLYLRYLQPNDYEPTAKLIIQILGSNHVNVSDVQLHQIGKRAEQLNAGNKRKIHQLYHDTIADLVPEPMKLEQFPATTVDTTATRSTGTGRKRSYVVHDSNGKKSYKSVENIALEYYIERCGYSDGRHCEGSLIKATFTLFFWDIIYNPEKVVPGTFLSKIQYVPLDMYTTYFYQNRKHAIDKRLKEIESDWPDNELLQFLKRSWELHSHECGYCEPGTIIKKPEYLEILVNCIGRKVLAKIYERLVKDLPLYIRGLPDLLVWNVDNKKSKFVEVVLEMNKLSMEKKLWLKYLMTIGADVEVCHVNSTSSKRMKSKNLKFDRKKEKPNEKKQTLGNIKKKKETIHGMKAKIQERKARVEKNVEFQNLDASQLCETMLEATIDEASTSTTEAQRLGEDSGISNETSDFALE